MKKYLVLLLAVISQTVLFAQKDDDTTITGEGSCYMSRLEYLNQEAYLGGHVIIEQRSRSSIRAYGGEDYVIEVVGQNGSFTKDLWGVQSGGALYINTSQISGGRGFAYAESKGKYILIFMAIPSKETMRARLEVPDDINSKMKDQLAKAMSGGAIGGVMGSGDLAEIRLATFCDSDSGTFHCLSQKYIDSLISANTDIDKKYKKLQFSTMTRNDIVELFNALNLLAGNNF